MPDISFYILPSQTEQGRYKFACRLAEKAYHSGSNVYIQSASAQQSRQLDDLLWTFRAGSFIPHQIKSNSIPPDAANKVLIGTDMAPENWQDIIINLSNDCPQYSENTRRILEILDNSEPLKQSGRIRYRQYQQSSCPIKTHQM